MVKLPSVSTHSHPKVAAVVFSVYSRFRAFQHTATRRWLLGGYLLINQTGNVSTHSHPKVAASWPVRALIIWVCFNTQPPEGGCSAAADAPVPVEPVSTHSHPKVAAPKHDDGKQPKGVSTHSHPKVAAAVRILYRRIVEVSTHSHPKVAAKKPT